MHQDEQHPLTDTEEKWRDDILGLPNDYSPEERAQDDAKEIEPLDPDEVPF